MVLSDDPSSEWLTRKVQFDRTTRASPTAAAAAATQEPHTLALIKLSGVYLAVSGIPPSVDTVWIWLFICAHKQSHHILVFGCYASVAHPGGFFFHTSPPQNIPSFPWSRCSEGRSSFASHMTEVMGQPRTRPWETRPPRGLAGPWGNPPSRWQGLCGVHSGGTQAHSSVKSSILSVRIQGLLTPTTHSIFHLDKGQGLDFTFTFFIYW